MNVLKTTKMNSKILVYVLLAYFLDNLSGAILKIGKSTSLDGKKTPPAQYINTSVYNQPTDKNPYPVVGSSKVNPVVSTSPASVSSPPAPPAPTILPSLKKENENDQGFDLIKERGDYEEGDDYEGDEGDDYEEVEDQDQEEHLENSKTVTSQPMLSSSNSKPIVPESVKKENDNHQGFEIIKKEGDYEGDEGDEGDDYEEFEDEDHEEHLENSKTVTSQPMLSSSNSKPIAPESVKQENDNHKGFEIIKKEGDYEGDEGDEGDYYEEFEDEDHEEHLENSKTVTSQPMLSSSNSKPIVPDNVKQENDNHQGFEIIKEEGDYEGDEGDDYEEVEDEDREEHLENSKTVTSQPMLSSSNSKPIVSDNVKQEIDNHQEFDIIKEGDDYEEEVPEQKEDGDNVEEYLEDPNQSTQTNNIVINGVRVNPPVPINNLISIVPQLSDGELAENNYNKSENSFNTNEDHQAYQNDDNWGSAESSNINNKPTDISETLDKKNDNTKDQAINTNDFESNSYDNTQIPTDKQEENIEDQFKNQYVSENKERIVNGYEAMKKILYMLQDYASSTFNWIINKINYRMEQLSS